MADRVSQKSTEATVTSGYNRFTGTRATIQSTAAQDIKYMKRNSKDYNDFSYFIAGIDVTQQNLDQMTPYIQGISRIFMHRTPLFMEIGFKDMTKQFKSLIETGAKAIGGIGDLNVETTSFDGGFNGQSFNMVSKTSDDSNTLSISVYEQAGSPVRVYLDTWINGMRDSRSGVSHYHGLVETPDHTGKDYIPYSEKNHTAEFIYYTLDPTAHYLEYACLWAHAFPTGVKKDHLNFTSGTHDGVEMDIQFNATKYESRYINDIAINYLIQDQLEYNYLNFNPDFDNKGYSNIDYRLNLPKTSSTILSSE